jgi:hypothetical protein
MIDPQLRLILLGACDSIKNLFPEHSDRQSLLRQALPYLSCEDIKYWANFYNLD